MKVIKQIFGWFKKVLNLLLYYVPIILYYGFGIFMVIFLSMSDKNVWPFIAIFVFITLIYFRKCLTAAFDTIKIGKDGIELKKTIKEAKDTIEELKILSCMFCKNLTENILSHGKIINPYNHLELLKYKTEIQNLSNKLNLNENQDIEKMLSQIDVSIIYEILANIDRYYLMHKNNFEMHEKIMNLFRTSSIEEVINNLEKLLISNNDLTEDKKEILEYARYYQKNLKFPQNKDLLKKV